MRSRIRLGGLVATLAIMATTGCTVSGLPWGDVKVTADKAQLQDFQLSGPTPSAQVADPQQYQGAVKNGTDTYARVRPCNGHYGVTCREGDIIYLFRDYIYLGYAYLWEGNWWTVPIGDGKTYDYWNHTYINWTMVDITQINIEQNITIANQFIDQHTEVYAPGGTNPGAPDQSAAGAVKPTTANATAGATANPSGEVTDVSLTALSCSSVTLTADGPDPKAQLDVDILVNGATFASASAARSTSTSSWTKTFSGQDLSKYATAGRVRLKVTAGNYSGTKPVDLPNSCASASPSSAASYSAPAYSAPSYSAPSYSAPTYSAPTTASSKSAVTSAPKSLKSAAGTPGL